MEDGPVGSLTGSQSILSFRELGRSDFPLLQKWLAAPHVAAWWNERFDLASLEAKYGPRTASSPTATSVRSSLIRRREIGARSARSERPASRSSIRSGSLTRPSSAMWYAWIAVSERSPREATIVGLWTRFPGRHSENHEKARPFRAAPILQRRRL